MMKLESIPRETSLGTNFLSRQVHLPQRGKTSSLLTRKKRDRLIFKENNKELTEDALNACRQLVINPELLMPKTLEDFAEAGITQNVQEIRFKHF